MPGPPHKYDHPPMGSHTNPRAGHIRSLRGGKSKVRRASYGLFQLFQTRYYGRGVSGAAKGQARSGKDPHRLFQSIVNTLTNAQIDDDLYDRLEEQLILADVGPACAVRLVDELHDQVEEKHLKTGQEALDALRGIICQELTPRYPMELDGKPAVILVIGVNGVGKTTTIAKLASLYKKQGRRVMLAAGDTFRAAASEQLELWADRAGVPLMQLQSAPLRRLSAIPHDMERAAFSQHAVMCHSPEIA